MLTYVSEVHGNYSDKVVFENGFKINNLTIFENNLRTCVLQIIGLLSIHFLKCQTV